MVNTKISSCRNDILDRFWKTGRYEKQPVHDEEAQGGLEGDGVKAHVEGCKETLSPAMDILISSNFERLMWFLAKGTCYFCRKVATSLPLELTGYRRFFGYCHE